MMTHILLFNNIFYIFYRYFFMFQDATERQYIYCADAECAKMEEKSYFRFFQFIFFEFFVKINGKLTLF